MSPDELELRSIFLDEAAEVVATGLQASKAMLQHPEKPENLELQSTLRRVFHTLKGSARMVGLDEFGEAGWAFEQLVNTKLADQKPFEADFCKLSIAALQSFQLWAKDIESNTEQHWKAETFRLAADAMRIDNRFDITGLIYVDNEIKTEQKVESVLTEDEALMLSLEAFELLELPEAPPEIVAEPVSEVVNKQETKEEVVEPLVAPVAPITVAVEVIQSSESNTSPVASKVIALADEVVENEAAPTQIPVIEEAHKAELIPTTVNTKSVVALKPKLDVAQHEEQFKVIGSLKIGIPLYNVYLNEADEWSRCLVTELDEWAIGVASSFANNDSQLCALVGG